MEQFHKDAGGAQLVLTVSADKASSFVAGVMTGAAQLDAYRRELFGSDAKALMGLSPELFFIRGINVEPLLSGGTITAAALRLQVGQGFVLNTSLSPDALRALIAQLEAVERVLGESGPAGH